MRSPKLSLWSSDQKFDNLILFAQLLEEMLYDYTIDSYKSPFSNPHSLLTELAQTINEERNRNKDLKNSDSVKALRDELLNKMSKDPISKKILNTHGEKNFDTLLKSIKEAKNFFDLFALIEPLIILFNEDNQYFEILKSELFRRITTPSEDKSEFSLLSREFVSELITIGFSQQFIYHKTEDYFFEDINRFSNAEKINQYLTDFFNFFQIEEKKWRIIIRGKKTFEKIAPIFSTENVKITKEKPLVQTGLDLEIRFINGMLKESKRNYPYFIIYNEIEAFDINSAKQKAEQYLTLLNSYIKFTTYHLELRWDPAILVISSENIPEISKPPVSSLAKIPRFKYFYWNELKLLKDTQISDMIASHLPQLYANLNDNGKYSFYKSMTFHNAATKSKESENQFLNIWIALETLLPISPEDTIFPKFKSSFEPILSTGYCDKLIRDFYKNIGFYLNNDYSKCYSLLPEDCAEFNDIEKCAAIIVSNDEKIQNFLKERIGRNPLFFLRLQELKKLFLTAKTIKEGISEHENRIKWHMQRMYRVRNKITHKGEKIQNIKYLTENLNSYYHVVVEHIDKCASEYNNLKNIESILAYCNISYTTYYQYLDSLKENECNNSNLRMLLFNKL
jgi:hypothetical protein